MPATPLILTSISKAGGVGKTTTAVNIAYEWSLRGYSVGIIDFDPNHSIDDFVAIEPQQDPKKTSLSMFDEGFDGDYPFISILDSDDIFLLQGHPNIRFLSESLSQKRRREYTLSKIFSKYPLEFDMIIIDLPGGINLVTENVICASTHILLPVHVGVKTFSSSDLVQEILQSFEELDLSPIPEIIGFLPNQYDKSSVSDNMVVSSLEDIASNLELKIYPPIRYWLNLKRSAIEGKALKQLRPGDAMNSVFNEVVDDLVEANN